MSFVQLKAPTEKLSSMAAARAAIPDFGHSRVFAERPITTDQATHFFTEDKALPEQVQWCKAPHKADCTVARRLALCLGCNS
jgi:hypothetical protein